MYTLYHESGWEINQWLQLSLYTSPGGFDVAWPFAIPFKNLHLNSDCDSSHFKELLSHLALSQRVNWKQNCSVVMKSRYNPGCVCSADYLCHNLQKCTRRGKKEAILNLCPSLLFKPESQIPHCPDTSVGHEAICHSIFLWLTGYVTVGYCHALVNPGTLPICHSSGAWHCTKTMLRAMQISMSHTTGKSGVFKEKLPRLLEKYV